MCDRAALLALATALIVAQPAAGQERATLRARIARLDVELKRAEAAAARADSGRAAAHTYDTVIVGTLRIAAQPGLGPDARAGAVAAWSLIHGTFGAAAATLTNQPFTLVDRNAREADPRAATAVFTTGSAADVEQRLVWAASMAMASRSDSGLTAWWGALVPTTTPERERRGAYVALVTAASPVGRRCYQGDLASCRSALGLLPIAQALSDWYDPARRRDLIRDFAEFDAVRADGRLYETCVAGLSDADCLTLLGRVPPAALPTPLPSAARHSLARTALAMGGQNAYARLLASAGQSLEARLAAASGVSGDSLLRAWHAAVFADRPLPVRVEARAGWVALGWGVLFGILALRSTRWR